MNIYFQYMKMLYVSISCYPYQWVIEAHVKNTLCNC